MYFCEHCKVFKNTYFEEHLRTAACVCAGVRLYSSTVKASSACKTSETYLRGPYQRCYVEYHSRCFFQVPSSPFLKIYIWPPKTPKNENSSEHKLERKRYDKCFRKNVIYIEIGYKSAAKQTEKWWKDTKDEEATLIWTFPLWIKSLALAYRGSVCSDRT